VSGWALIGAAAVIWTGVLLVFAMVGLVVVSLRDRDHRLDEAEHQGDRAVVAAWGDLIAALDWQWPTTNQETPSR